MSYWSSRPSQQSQAYVQKQDVAMRQILMDQMDDCFEMIKRYLKVVIQMEQLKKEKQNTTVVKQNLEFSNFAMGQSINLLQISLNDCFKQNKQEDIELAQSKLSLFGKELSEATKGLDRDTRAEIQKRVDPIRNNLLKIVKGEKVPLNAPPVLTNKTFNEETVGIGMGKYLKAGHEIQDRKKEVEQNPNEFYKQQEQVRNNTREDVQAMLSYRTSQLESNSMAQDIDINNIDQTFGKEDQNKNKNNHCHYNQQYRRMEKNEYENFINRKEFDSECPDAMNEFNKKYLYQNSKVNNCRPCYEQTDFNSKGPSMTSGSKKSYSNVSQNGVSKNQKLNKEKKKREEEEEEEGEEEQGW